MGIICVSRQIGAGETTIAPAVAQALGWKCFDHQMLDREVAETGINLPKITHFDEHAPGLIEAWSHPHEAERYFDALKHVIEEYADEGNAILVGRGAGFILRGRDILHVRLIADMPFRLKRVMEIRWAAEHHAREIIKQNDHDRGAFHRKFFHLDWNDTLLYDFVVATSHVGVQGAIDSLVAIARTRWPGTASS